MGKQNKRIVKLTIVFMIHIFAFYIFSYLYLIECAIGFGIILILFSIFVKARPIWLKNFSLLLLLTFGIYTILVLEISYLYAHGKLTLNIIEYLNILHLIEIMMLVIIFWVFIMYRKKKSIEND